MNETNEERQLRALVIYFSTTGNTKKVATSILDALQEEKLRVTFLKVEDAGKEELYDLTVDRTEQQNIVERSPEVRQQMQQILEEWRSSYGWELSTSEYVQEPLPPQIEEQLRALGYMD